MEMKKTYLFMVIYLFTTSYLYANGEVRIKNVPIICQYPELPTGCEVTALTMLLRASGTKVTKEEVANSLTRVSLPYYNKEKKIGYSPDEGFVGNPFSKNSYGVYAKPILKLIEKYVPSRGEDLCGKTLDEVLKVVDEGRPVMIWATINMVNVSYTQSWNLENGEMFWWPNNEHAVVIVGYDSNYIYLNDPYVGKEKRFDRKLVTKQYNALGRQAVAILPEQYEMQLEVNGNKVQLEEKKKILNKQGQVFLPLCYLKEIDILASYQYANKVCTLKLPGISSPLLLAEVDNKEKRLCIDDDKEQGIVYLIKDGITRISLQSLSEMYAFDYDIEDKLVKINY